MERAETMRAPRLNPVLTPTASMVAREYRSLDDFNDEARKLKAGAPCQGLQVFEGRAAATREDEIVEADAAAMAAEDEDRRGRGRRSELKFVPLLAGACIDGSSVNIWIFYDIYGIPKVLRHHRGKKTPPVPFGF